MDHLDQVAAPATALLDRVDAVLGRAGAPAAHPVWRWLRQVGALPGAAAAAVLALDPGPVDATVLRLRGLLQAADEAAAAVPGPGDWAGEAADAYDAARRRLSGDISGAPDCLADQFAAAAGHGEAVARWIRQTREDLARALAEVLCCAEAVTLLTGDPAEDSVSELPARAAADIAALVLQTVAFAYEEADELVGPAWPQPIRA